MEAINFALERPHQNLRSVRRAQRRELQIDLVRTDNVHAIRQFYTHDSRLKLTYSHEF